MQFNSIREREKKKLLLLIKSQYSLTCWPSCIIETKGVNEPNDRRTLISKKIQFTQELQSEVRQLGESESEGRGDDADIDVSLQH